MIYSDDPGPCTPQRTRAADGARLVACAHGGQILGWTPAGATRDRLWLSPLARCGPGDAIRGGIPVVFPQFAGRGPLPKHGLARDRGWELDTGSDGAPAARIAARLRADDDTRRIWPHPFTLTLVAEATGFTLDLTLQVRNDAPAGGEPFAMTVALHTYLSADPDRATLTGLAGCRAEDNAAGGAVVRIPDGPLPTRGPLDLAVRDTRGPIRLDDGLGGRLEVSCASPTETGTGGAFDSLVVWNPGDDHGLADVPPGAAGQFLCVEPALLTPVLVEPQGVWRATARLTALVPDL